MNEKSNFAQAFWLGIGQLGAYALAFVSAAILSRYLDKTEYGTYKQILFVYTTLQSLFTIGLPSVFAYLIPKLRISQQKTLIIALNRLFLLLGLVFSVLLFVLSTPISNLLKNPELSVGLKIFSPFPLFTLPAMGVEGIYTALKKTKIITVYNIISKLLMLICILTPVILFDSGYKGAIIGWGIASFITFLIAMYLKNRPYCHVIQELIPNMYKTIFDYSLPLMGAFITGFFCTSADQFYISRFYGTETFAEYSNGCLSIPFIAMIATSVKNVLLPVFSKADEQNSLHEAVIIYNNAVIRMSVLIIPMILYSLFFAESMMVFLYGMPYVVSANYLRLFTLREFVSIFPYYAVLLSLGLSKIYLYMHVIGAIYIWLADFIVVQLNCTAIFIVLVQSSFYILCMLFAMIYLNKYRGLPLVTVKMLKHLFTIFIHSLSCACISYIVVVYILHLKSHLLVLLISLIFFILILVVSGKIIFKIDYLDALRTIKSRR